jgi:predicted nuclease with RNAse H fold
MDTFCGIDVSFAKRKALPVAVCSRAPSGLTTLPLRHRDSPLPPRGAGNRATLDPAILTAYAEDVRRYLHAVENRFGTRIVRVAIDAPRSFAPQGERRAAERAMDANGLSCFATPSRAQFDAIRDKAESHLRAGGAESRLPHANQLWMLVGFALFERLAQDFECIEVFPNAIVKALDPDVSHKSTSEGYARQLDLLRHGTGIGERELNLASHGARHDRLDAVLSAWVASLEPCDRVAHGDGGFDTIWSVRRSH